MEKKYERFLEAYFTNTLNEAEQNEMKALLASDPDFAAEFAWQQSVARAIRTRTENDPTYLKLKELERRFRFRRVIMQISAVAATIILLISAIWLFKQPTGENQIAVTQNNSQQVNPTLPTAPPQQDSLSSNESQTRNEQERERQQAEEALRRQQEEAKKKRLLQDSLQKAVVARFRHFQNTSPYNNAGSNVEEKDSLAVKAYRFYNDLAYHQAAHVFKALVEADTSNMENRFYYGVSLLGNQQFAASAKAFQAVTEKQSKYQTPAKFYLGMALSANGEYKAARQSFESYLAAPSGNRQFKDLTESMLKKLPPQ